MGRPNDIPRVCVRDLEGYKRTLKVGQEKRINVLIKRGADWSTWVRAVIIGIYKNLVKVRYRIMVTEEGIRCEAIREEYIRIADLLIWEIGGYGERTKNQ